MIGRKQNHERKSFLCRSDPIGGCTCHKLAPHGTQPPPTTNHMHCILSWLLHAYKTKKQTKRPTMPRQVCEFIFLFWSTHWGNMGGQFNIMWGVLDWQKWLRSFQLIFMVNGFSSCHCVIVHNRAQMKYFKWSQPFAKLAFREDSNQSKQQ